MHSIRGDGTVKLSKSMRELQRRWRNTVRIDEKLYAPDEMLDRAVLDNQGEEIGVITGLFRVKRTYKGVIVTTRMRTQMEFGVDEQIRIPITALARTRERLDEAVLSRTLEKVMQLPSYITINSMEEEESVRTGALHRSRHALTGVKSASLPLRGWLSVRAPG